MTITHSEVTQNNTAIRIAITEHRFQKDKRHTERSTACLSSVFYPTNRMAWWLLWFNSYYVLRTPREPSFTLPPVTPSRLQQDVFLQMSGCWFVTPVDSSRCLSSPAEMGVGVWTFSSYLFPCSSLFLKQWWHEEHGSLTCFLEHTETCEPRLAPVVLVHTV